MHVGAILLAAVFCMEVSMNSGGPSTRQDRPGDSWIAITDARNTDENECQIDRLLSAGHDVEVVDETHSDTMGHAGAVILHPNGTMEGGHDPRADSGVAGV